LPEGGGGGADGFLVSGGKGSECVLHTVSKLAKHGVRDVCGVLGDKINTHTLGADQPNNLFNLLQESFRGIIKQQVRFVEKEHEFGFVGVADFR